MQEETRESNDLQETLGIISEIITICHNNPDLTSVATHRLNELIYYFDSKTGAIQMGNKSRAERAIEDHLLLLKKNHKPIKPTSIVYRDIAIFLSKKHDLPFDPKVIKKKTDLIQWFNDNWTTIQDQFFFFFDQHPDNK